MSSASVKVQYRFLIVPGNGGCGKNIKNTKYWYEWFDREVTARGHTSVCINWPDPYRCHQSVWLPFAAKQLDVKVFGNDGADADVITEKDISTSNKKNNNIFAAQMMPKTLFSCEKMKRLVELLKSILLPEYFPPQQTALHAVPTLADIGCTMTEFLNLLREQIVSAAFVYRWEKSRMTALGQNGEAADDDDSRPMQNHGVDHPEKKLFVLSEGDVVSFQCEVKNGTRSCQATVNAFSSEAFKPALERLEDHIISPLIAWLPELAELVRLDIAAALAADVVVSETAEIAYCYPGLNALIHHRFAHKLLRLGAPILVARILANIAHEATGVDIHPGAIIGKSCFIDHATGVVIGGTCEIGDNCKMFQGITLGAKSFPRDKKTGKRIKHLPRHPIVEDDVTIYSNAVVLGRVTVGKGAIIGGNVWVTESVEPKAIVQQEPAEKTIYKEVPGFDEKKKETLQKGIKSGSAASPASSDTPSRYGMNADEISDESCDGDASPEVEYRNIVVGHSTGALLVMRMLERCPSGLYGAILVSAAHTDLDDEGERASGFFDEPWDWARMGDTACVGHQEKEKKTLRFIHQFHSVDDHLIPVAEGRFVARQLSQSIAQRRDRGVDSVAYFEYEELNGYGHFFKPFQPLLDVVDKWCK